MQEFFGVLFAFTGFTDSVFKCHELSRSAEYIPEVNF